MSADPAAGSSPPAPEVPVLRVRGLTRTYSEQPVVDDLDLELRAGEAVALIGPNGSGKSTALRCITGAEEATAGTVELDGSPLDERSPAIRRRLAVVMDDIDFFPDLSVVEHLDLLAHAHGVQDAEEVVDEVLHSIGLVPQSGQLPGTLSSGQRRRLALASAFVRPRRLLILDEPEARLDQEGLEWLIARLQAEKQAGLAIVMATHHPRLTEEVADRATRMGARH